MKINITNMMMGVMVLLSLYLTGCKMDQLPEVPVKTPEGTGGAKINISLDNHTISVPGGSLMLHVTISPATADQTYTLHIVEGNGIADLTNNVLTARQNGTVIISATSGDKVITDSCNVSISNQINSTNRVRILQDTLIESSSNKNSDILIFQPKTPMPLIFKNNSIVSSSLL